MSEIHAIPTSYAGVNFRSRLEARWAAFFDLIAWPWEYEPVELDGYIPDFVLKFYRPLLVEVKPVEVVEYFAQHKAKIDASGWRHRALIVGSYLFNGQHGDGCMAGLMRDKAVDNAEEWWWGWSSIVRCLQCGYALVSDDGCWECIRCGAYDGARQSYAVPKETLDDLWREAGNRVQWKGVQS